MSTPSGPLIRALTFEADGSVVVEYCIPLQDARVNGVVLNHTMLIPRGSDYDEEIDHVNDAVAALLADVLEDLPVLEPITIRLNDADEPDEPDEDGDDA